MRHFFSKNQNSKSICHKRCSDTAKCLIENVDKKATAEIQTELDKLHEFYQEANKTSITIPEILRIGIYYLAYRYAKEQEISGRSNRISIEKYIEHELGLSKNAFNKWHMHPRNDYAFFQDKVRLHIYRPGRKTGNLLNMIRYLAVTSECENFVDVFGGTGASAFRFLLTLKMYIPTSLI